MFRVRFVDHETEHEYTLAYAVRDAAAALYNFELDMDQRNLTMTAEVLAVVEVPAS
jgi:hypothetical protein